MQATEYKVRRLVCPHVVPEMKLDDDDVGGMKGQCCCHSCVSGLSHCRLYASFPSVDTGYAPATESSACEIL